MLSLVSEITFIGWREFARNAISSGCVLAMAGICLIQYAWHTWRMSRTVRDKERHKREMRGLEHELSSVERDRSLTRLENQMLREFVAETDGERALQLLLRRYIPNSGAGFVVYVRFESRVVVVQASRGLSQGSLDSLEIDEGLLYRLQSGRSVSLDGRDLARSGLLRNLALADRNKARQLFLVPALAQGELIGALLTTHLSPIGAAPAQQLELAERLMAGLAGSLQRQQELEVHQQQLRWTTDMLELRALADRRFETPLKMVQEFVRRLGETLHADRVTLSLSQANSGTNGPLASWSTALPVGLREQWQRCEEQLNETARVTDSLTHHDIPGLAKLGIVSLIGAAMTVPLRRADSTIAVLCVTRRSREPFNDDQQQLVSWAAEFLGDRILRAVNHAAVERQARIDGLTQLSNRRTFDLQFAREAQIARDGGHECSVVLLDLDHFKSINDRHGHLAGDHVLRLAAQIVREVVASAPDLERPMCARYGGEEFVLLLPCVSTDLAARIAESIRVAVASTPAQFEGTSIRMTISSGVATFPAHALSLDEVLAAADGALYQAKAAGRNRVGTPEPAVV